MSASFVRAPKGDADLDSGPLSVRVEEDLRVDADWDQLAREVACGGIFSTAAWHRIWRKTLGMAADVLAVRVFQGDTLVAAAAFAHLRGVVEFAGKGPTDYHDVLLDPRLTDETAGNVVRLILRTAADSVPGFRRFNLSRIPAASRLIPLLDACGFFAMLRSEVEAPRMAMSTAPDALRKKSLKRHERGLEKLGTLASASYAATNEIEPRLDAFFDLHVRRWAASDSPSLFLDDRNRAFYRELTRELGGQGWLRFTEIRLDDRLIAAHFGFMLDGCFTWYKPCYEPELSRHSPGEVLIKRLIEQAVEEGANTFDFTIGNEAFKQRFASEAPCVMNASLTGSAMAHLARKVARQMLSTSIAFRSHP